MEEIADLDCSGVTQKRLSQRLSPPPPASNDPFIPLPQVWFTDSMGKGEKNQQHASVWSAFPPGPAELCRGNGKDSQGETASRKKEMGREASSSDI